MKLGRVVALVGERPGDRHEGLGFHMPLQEHVQRREDRRFDNVGDEIAIAGMARNRRQGGRHVLKVEGAHKAQILAA